MSIDSEKLRQARYAEFGSYFIYLSGPKKQPLSSESTKSISYYNEYGDLLYRPYILGHLRKKRAFRDKLVIPCACIPMVLHECHDHAMSGGHLACKHMFNKVRDRFWWSTLHHDVKLGAMTAKHVNGVNHRIAGPSYLQVTCPLIARSNVFQEISSNTKRNQYPQ